MATDKLVKGFRSELSAMDMSLAKKVVLITGGSFGIGRKLAETVASEKALVSVCDVNEADGVELEEKLNKEHGEGTAMFMKCDVTDRNAFRDFFQKTKDRFGRIDVVVNNAGFFDDSDQKWESMVDVNVKGVITGSLLALEFMGTENGGEGGTVLNISSVVGFHRMIFMPIYSASKAAVLMFTRNMGDELHFSKNHVKFIAICPHGSLGSHFFENTRGRFLYPDGYLEDKFEKCFDVQSFQSVDHVAQSIANVLKVGSNGSIWLIENGEKEKEVNIVDPKIHGVDEQPKSSCSP
ncbi:15-hydroxyprostaglandin dehydrogenase [NAD(+)]-like [Cimex lectularius]|uniref:15-hydroxyprostaglandin dehydrogenase [NAD(+)] n=1 Tax=Cimex lectularius TaxID=79782 RepID=A0A8I6RQR4_CIMLE|nr:15-hydroxyprostaglandin dehydrogenase [NAD(+)]-like [Cimex lectularius]